VALQNCLHAVLQQSESHGILRILENSGIPTATESSIGIQVVQHILGSEVDVINVEKLVVVFFCYPSSRAAAELRFDSVRGN
jgi:hypothetical protein